MAVATKTIVGQNVNGKFREVDVDVAINDYVTGGISVTPANAGMLSFVRAIISGGTPGAAAYVLWWDSTNNKLMASTSAAGALAQVANAADLSAVTVRMTFVGN